MLRIKRGGEWRKLPRAGKNRRVGCDAICMNVSIRGSSFSLYYCAGRGRVTRCPREISTRCDGVVDCVRTVQFRCKSSTLFVYNCRTNYLKFALCRSLAGRGMGYIVLTPAAVLVRHKGGHMGASGHSTTLVTEYLTRRSCSTIRIPARRSRRAGRCLHVESSRGLTLGGIGRRVLTFYLQRGCQCRKGSR